MTKELKDKEFEFSIEIRDKKYADQLLVALARQGYCVYFGYQEHPGDMEKVCIPHVSGRDLIETTRS